MALTYAEIRDPDGEDAVSAKVTRSSLDRPRPAAGPRDQCQPHRLLGGHRGLGGNGARRRLRHQPGHADDERGDLGRERRARDCLGLGRRRGARRWQPDRRLRRHHPRASGRLRDRPLAGRLLRQGRQWRHCQSRRRGRPRHRRRGPGRPQQCRRLAAQQHDRAVAYRDDRLRHGHGRRRRQRRRPGRRDADRRRGRSWRRDRSVRRRRLGRAAVDRQHGAGSIGGSGTQRHLGGDHHI